MLKFAVNLRVFTVTMNTNKIKIEPGTSKLPTVIKYEDGRLPSLLTRNLKLGGKPFYEHKFKEHI